MPAEVARTRAPPGATASEAADRTGSTLRCRHAEPPSDEEYAISGLSLADEARPWPLVQTRYTMPGPGASSPAPGCPPWRAVPRRQGGPPAEIGTACHLPAVTGPVNSPPSASRKPPWLVSCRPPGETGRLAAAPGTGAQVSASAGADASSKSRQPAA